MTKTGRFSWLRHPEFWTVAVVVVIFGAAAALGIHKGNQWREFKIAHNCQKVGHVSGDVLPIVSISTSTGQPSVGMAIEADKTGWKCNDGVTYWK